MYKIKDEFIERLKKEEKNSLFEFLFGIMLFCLFGTAMYFNNSGMSLIIELFGLGVIVAIYIYARTIRKSRIINETIIEVKSEGDRLIFITANFSLLFIFKIENLPFNLDKNDLKWYPTYYPLESIFDYKGGCFKITFQEREYYILSGWFNDNINNILN